MRIRKIIIIFILGYICIRACFFQTYKIPTTSMVPVLMPGDLIFVNKFIYGLRISFANLRICGFKKPKRGEVIVFISPNEKRKVYIKRLIGISGDSVLLKKGNVYINDKIAVDPRIAVNKYTNNHGDYGRYGKEIIVPQGKYFFLGDNSENSQDSRFWGFVDEKDIVGKAVLIWWPPERIEMIE